MAWTAFPTWIVGQISLASDWNTYVADNMEFLATPPLCRVYRNGALTLTAGSYTLVPYDTVTIDTASGFNTSTHLYTAQVAGSYLTVGALTAATITSGHNTSTAVYYNGNVWAVGNNATANTSNYCCSIVVDIITGVAVGQTIEWYYQAVDADTCETGSQWTYASLVKVSN